MVISHHVNQAVSSANMVINYVSQRTVLHLYYFSFYYLTMVNTQNFSFISSLADYTRNGKENLTGKRHLRKVR